MAKGGRGLEGTYEFARRGGEGKGLANTFFFLNYPALSFILSHPIFILTVLALPRISIFSTLQAYLSIYVGCCRRGRGGQMDR